ncbi:MAG TPA: phospholipid carrier-dependent glycosyltransferase [Acidimicrobiales bacterium]|nr:phospholipid carrier-dependent glycosyltransferase [Acidimicrobiales bacterium]
MTDRGQRLLIALIACVGLLRGLWWVAVTPVWSPIDEQAHYDYVEAIGRGDGIPIVGQTHVHADVLALAKSSPSSRFHDEAIPSVLHESYEAAQPPLYYALMAPVWRVFEGARTSTTMYALRVATLLVSLLLIPLVYLIGRELWPGEPSIGVVAAALVAVWSGTNSNFAIVANDGLMTVLAAATFLVMARAVRRGLTTRRAAVTGVLVGATVLTKTTGLSIVAVVAIAAVLAARWHGQRLADVVRFGAIAGAIAAVLLAPWLAFNHAHYGGLTAAKQLDAITGSLQSNPPFNLHGLATRLRQGGHGFFDAQIVSPNATHAGKLWFAAAALFGVGAALRLWRRRAGRDLALLAWLLAAWPLAFFTMAVVILHLSGGRSDIAGRHLYVALPAVALALALAASRGFGRAGVGCLALVAAVALTLEAGDVPWLVHLVEGTGSRYTLAMLAPRAWAVIGWGVAVAAFSIARWGKRETGSDASRSSSAAAPSAPLATP